MSDPITGLAELLEQARQRLALHPCAIEENKDDDPPVSSRLVDHVVSNLTQLREVHRESDADTDAYWVPAVPSYLDEDGDEVWSQWEGAAAEKLRRMAAFAIVVAALHRSAYEEQLITALVALEAADSAERERCGADSTPSPGVAR
ncbi:MAG TPA: hypothetical protein VGX25_00630 [Actinophytocola sp.]|uniref:hypothetical protein n=1 Tax=Actinophytocola sp. TaxID=1872138 RepID=UPI002DDDBBAE|nr:hypothetical protein [Actinophytocola sp.]HEV2777884.1 hypothetical protein [Actinophytocola sp.]